MKRKYLITAAFTMVIGTIAGITSLAAAFPKFVIPDEGDKNHYYIYSEKDGAYYKRCVCDFGGQFVQAPHVMVDRFGEHGILIMNLPDNTLTLHDDGCRTNSECVVMGDDGNYIRKTPQELGYGLESKEVVEVAYDANYPLKRLIDKHDIRLKAWPEYKNRVEATGRNEIARLTGQMDAYCDEIARANKYYDEHPGEESKRAADIATQQSIKAEEDQVVEKLRNWLNSWDVEHATETEKYNKMREFFAGWQYDYELYNAHLAGSHEAAEEIMNTGHDPYYRGLIRMKGVCGHFSDACSLVARLLGLRYAVMMNAGEMHEFVLIKADGVVYGAENGSFTTSAYDYTARNDAMFYNIPSFE